MFMYYSSDTDERGNLFTQMLVVIAGVQMDHVFLLKQFEHLDPNNQNTFEAKDLELLIVTVTPIPNMLKCEIATKKITNQEHRLTSNQCILVRQLHLTFQMLVDKILNFLLFVLIRFYQIIVYIFFKILLFGFSTQKNRFTDKLTHLPLVKMSQYCFTPINKIPTNSIQ